MTFPSRIAIFGIAAVAVNACGASATPFGKDDGGSDSGRGGSTGTGGAVTTGGAPGTGGGMVGSGGAPGTGGNPGSGGGSATGGNPGTGAAGRLGSGGAAIGGSGGGATGGAGGGSACRNLNHSQCVATAGCAVRSCPACLGGSMFSGCFASSGPIDACPPLAGCPPNCAGLTESSCRATTGCRAETCPTTCSGGATFIQCSAMVATPVSCPPIACPVSCEQVTTVADCDARNDCHSVFVDPQSCGCDAPGCCARFLRCAPGDKALCKPAGPFGCAIVEPVCEGPYVVAYTASCFEGCARSTDCAP